MASNEKRIVKNAGALYLRTALSIIIQLFAVRYLLKYLGVESYGLYGLVGSIVIIAENVVGQFSTTIQRFINIELGKNNPAGLKEIYNTSLRIVGVMAVIGMSLVIVVGLCILPFLKIPDHLQISARLILLFSSITLGLHLFNTVYSGIIIAFERFFFSAMVGIGQNIFKFISVLCLIFFSYERVVWYAVFVMIAAGGVILVNWIFCRINFSSVITLAKVENKSYYKEIFSFASFRMFGTISTSIQTSGIDFLLNLFGGLVVNTARTIAYQVINAVNILVWNLYTGFSPRCITVYGEGRFDEFNRLVFLMMKCNLLINITLGFVISVFVEPILKIWLGEIPPYTPWFIRIIFLYFIVRVIQDALDLIFTAIGRIKQFQTYLGISQIVSVFIGGIFLWKGAPYYFIFVSMTIMEMLFVIVSLELAHRLCQFDVRQFIRKIFIPASIYLAIIIAIFIVTPTSIKNESHFLLLSTYLIVALIVSFSLGCFILFGKRAIIEAKKIITRKI